MRDTGLQRTVRGALGFALGLGLWAGFIGPYTAVVARTSEPILRLFESPNVTRLEAAGSEVVIDRSDLFSRSAKPAIALDAVTFNVILLVALFFSNRNWLSNRNFGGLGLAVLSLFPIHLAALIVNIQAIYALRLGAWSEMHYNRFERNLWPTLGHFYSVVGVFAAAILLWWIFSPRTLTSDEPPAKAGGGRRKRKRQA